MASPRLQPPRILCFQRTCTWKIPSTHRSTNSFAIMPILRRLGIASNPGCLPGSLRPFAHHLGARRLASAPISAPPIASFGNSAFLRQLASTRMRSFTLDPTSRYLTWRSDFDLEIHFHLYLTRIRQYAQLDVGSDFALPRIYEAAGGDALLACSGYPFVPFSHEASAGGHSPIEQCEYSITRPRVSNFALGRSTDLARCHPLWPRATWWMRNPAILPVDEYASASPRPTAGPCARCPFFKALSRSAERYAGLFLSAFAFSNGWMMMAVSTAKTRENSVIGF